MHSYLRMSKFKVFNDPLYGLINFPFEIIYELIDHRYFQRLRRITQVGLSSLVYPGATHTRFHHALGVAHLCSELIINLRLKGIEITDQEYEATCIAALLHDIGHGPFSHALEHQILPIHHEHITMKMMELLNEEYDGQLSLAIKIFKGEYPKKFLHQLLSSQLDVDRMDYLNRDSYYTGVAEGVIGYDRIIKMMNVWDNQLIVESKAIYSIEKFLISRYLMYRQVYLHKTAISAEQMLKAFYSEFKIDLINDIYEYPVLYYLSNLNKDQINQEAIELFSTLDDHDIISILKKKSSSKNFILKYLSKSILNRRLFRTLVQKTSFNSDFIAQLRLKTENMLLVKPSISSKLVIFGADKSNMYNKQDEIIIMHSPSETKPFAELSQFQSIDYNENLNFISFPKEISEIN